ncbi:MAG: endonuclease/exonuclease/phosphatase family protein [Aggregatilineales bacterium]
MIEHTATTTPQNIQLSTPNPFKILLTMTLYFFRAMTGAYGMSVSGFLILRLVISEEQWMLIPLFNSFIHLLILPALVLVPIVVLMHRWELLALTIAPFGAFMLWYGGGFFTTAPTIPDDAPRLSMVTFNIASFGTNLDEFTTLIREIDADVVLLQELGEEASATFAEAFAETYPYQALYPVAGRVRGQGVLSRVPILEEEAYVPYTYYQQRLLLDLDGQEVALYNVHLVYPFANNFARRRQDVQELLARMDAESVPVIVGGDFNLTERNIEYDWMTNDYTDAYRSSARGLGWTFAPFGHLCVDNFPVCAAARIDYFFHSAGISAASAQVWERTAGSDHYPVRVELALVD